MKTKGSKTISLRTMGIIALVFAVALLALRFVTVIFNVNPETGFFSKDSALNLIPYILAGLMIVFFAVVSFLSGETNSFNPNGYRSAVSVFALFAALSFGFDAVSSLLDLGQVDASSQATTRILLFTGVLRAAFAVLSLVYFIFAFNDERKGGTSSSTILALAPACWVVVRLVALFTSKISYVRISDLLFQIIYLSLFALFFVNFAQIKCGVYSEGNSWKVFAYGTPGAVIALSVMIVRLALAFSEKWTLYKTGYPFIFADAMVSLYILNFLFSAKNYVLAAKAPSEETASDEEAEAVITAEETSFDETTDTEN